MKKLFIFPLLLLLPLLICACSGSEAKVTVSVKITVMDSETGYSGVLYQNDSYGYKLGSPNVDGVLNALTKAEKINYFFDGSFITINNFNFFDALDNSYSRAWIVKINGTGGKGVFAEISEGDAIELTYIVFPH